MIGKNCPGGGRSVTTNPCAAAAQVALQANDRMSIYVETLIRADIDTV
jgi:hypothetical protein